MSSSRCVLQNERPKRPCEFTFTWSIHNYSYCTLKERKPIEGPYFEVEFLEEDKLWLQLYPRGCDAPGFVSCYLFGNGGGEIKFTLSIRKTDGQFKEGNECVYDIGSGYENFLSIEELEGPNGYLINDTLTLRCRIWKEDTDIPLPMKCDVHSKFKVSKLNYTWLLKDIAVSNHASECEFNKSSDIKDLLNGITKSTIHLINEGSLSESDIYFGIEIKSMKKKYSYLKCKIHFLDANRKIVHSRIGEHEILDSTQTNFFKFAVISKRNFYINKNVYAPRGQLTLQCEFGFASDNVLKTIEYRTTNDSEPQLSMTEPDTEHEIWIKNMRQCYEDGKFSDFIIRTPDREFTVSRTILSAHSDVFCAMFESDMKERKSGVVEIEDLDDDTVSKMLMYVYTSTLEEIDCSAAQKLYLAADKYGITSLQKKCSVFLTSCIDNSNVCDILDLADTLQDQDLKSCARDFVQIHAKIIINCDSWKKLMETNAPLTSETMQWMLCNKFLI